MKFIFWGGKAIGNYILGNLLSQNYIPEGIICYREELDSGIIDKAIEKGTKIYKIKKFKTEIDNIIHFIKLLHADTFLSVSFPFIIPKEILKLATYPINIHTGAIPKYRGHHPISAALLNDEPYQATTVHIMVPDVDAGEILLQDYIYVNNEDTILSIRQKLIELSHRLLLKVFDQIQNNTLYPYSQTGEIIWAPKRTPDDSRLDFNNNSRYIHNFIRALVDPYPNAFVFKENERINIKRSLTSNTPGKVLAKINSKEYIVSTGDGVVYIETDKELNIGDILN